VLNPLGHWADYYKLKAIEITGGPAKDIAGGAVGRGGAWSPEGGVVF
jgi:hypothetical protein